VHVDHQQTPLPGITQPLTEHTRSHAEDAEDEHGSHDDFTTTPLESSALPECVPAVEQHLLHKKNTNLIITTRIHSMEQFKERLHNMTVKMNAF
jgi:hypothetical protein